MEFLKKIASIFSAPGGGSENVHVIYVRSTRCKEVLSARINLSNDLAMTDDEGYISRKTLSGSGKNHCFDQVQVTLHFDNRKNLIDQEISGGAFITAEEFEAAQTD